MTMLVRKFSKTGELVKYLEQLGLEREMQQGFIEEETVINKCKIQFKGFIHECGYCNVSLRVGGAR